MVLWRLTQRQRQYLTRILCLTLTAKRHLPLVNGLISPVDGMCFEMFSLERAGVACFQFVG